MTSFFDLKYSVKKLTNNSQQTKATQPNTKYPKPNCKATKTQQKILIIAKYSAKLCSNNYFTKQF
ncbi:hypothetical protein KAOT1_05592 [Kordia algicida OT-1]|uniref:Uncharacterized protein n=1 Tax=Kordia algicida OT-1 TaxID=391587 RepID=A9E0H0_9FLAO|nr:hypothetical protein KAOT1_05592 [Kordia algicida OT-1]